MQAIKELYSLIRNLMRHKLLFARVASKLNVPAWLIIMHDMTKLLPSELIQYIAHGGNRPAGWLHYEHAKHHWQHWNGTEIPEPYASEMIADWVTASYEKRESPSAWFDSSRNAMILHTGTASYIERVISSEFKDFVF